MVENPVILITGATDGLGRALADRLASQGARLILHGRDAERLATVADEIAASGAERPRAVLADLADLAQVARLAEDVAGMTDRLDVLVNNAGIGSGEPDGRERRVSADGYELRFAVNYLAGFRLTLGLIPRMRVARSAGPARIVLVASLGQNPLDFGDLMITHGYSGQRAYGQSKLAQIMFGIELAHRLPASEITVNSLHPATYMPTKMVLREVGHSVDTLEAGVDATARLAADPSLDGKTGRFYDRQREAQPHEQAFDPVARRELWQRSLELTRIPDPFA
ncbi:SDR family NAD(P)-dependent oxidoreductase [Lysinimonas soli]|uniref:SDR family NAD(P)-dependent oxidoreductase n=1 Tax=Lysinimonas soli TaxID=1074233 RepID=A0ABW0NV56_9MICO